MKCKRIDLISDVFPFEFGKGMRMAMNYYQTLLQRDGLLQILY